MSYYSKKRRLLGTSPETGGIKKTVIKSVLIPSEGPSGIRANLDRSKVRSEKIISNFKINTSDVDANGEIRKFIITGTKGAVFTLEIKSGNDYYNFTTNLFQSTETKLNSITLKSNSYIGELRFPKVSEGAQYDIFLYAESSHNTKHAKYTEVKAIDDSIDINASTGSNSNLMRKVIYQTTSVTITLQSFAPNGTITGTVGNQAITATRNKSILSVPFSFNFDVSSTRTLTIDRQPVDTDVMAFVTPVVGEDPINISGENIYPTVTAANKVVNGAVSSGTNVTMDDDFTGLWAVGDKITGNAAFDARTQETAVTVTAINVGSNAKVFTMSEAIAIDDDETLSFSNRRNHRWPISATAFDVSKITPGMKATKGGFFQTLPKVSEYLDQITVLEGELEEYKIDKVKIPGLDTLNQKPITVRNASTKVATTTVGSSATPVNITFDNQALLSMAGETIKVFSYGPSEVKRLTGYDLEFNNLAVTLNEVKTTTTSAVNNSTSIPIADRAGIMDAISSVKGVGIDNTTFGTDTVNGAVSGATSIVMDANVANTMSVGDTVTGTGISDLKTITVTAINVDTNVKKFSVSEAVTISDGVTLSFTNPKAKAPTVVSGAGSVTGAGTIVVSSAQTLESGAELSFPKVGTKATISGNIKINKVGNEDVTLRFDLENMLTMH
tara:strand:+ start:944 stop:2953 length:2010 start_codon:yes stop_codon:yes gene_type:complete